MTTRLFVTRSDFGKIIGKGGTMISNIRSKCGAVVKGSDINDNDRLVRLNYVSRFDRFYVLILS